MLRLSGAMSTSCNPLAPHRRQGWVSPCLASEGKAVTRNAYLSLSFTSNLIMIAGLLFLLSSARDRVDAASTLMLVALLAATPTMNYASFCFAKDGHYYPGMMTRLPMISYVRTKVRFMRGYSGACSVVILPFLLAGAGHMMFAYGAFVVYYAGLGGMIMVYVSSFDRNKIRLAAPPLFNTQGISFLKTLFVLPVVTPLFFFENFRETSLWISLLLGAAGFGATGWINTAIEANLARRKHRYLAL
jgi:hypothetical protein